MRKKSIFLFVSVVLLVVSSLWAEEPYKICGIGARTAGFSTGGDSGGNY